MEDPVPSPKFWIATMASNPHQKVSYPLEIMISKNLTICTLFLILETDDILPELFPKTPEARQKQIDDALQYGPNVYELIGVVAFAGANREGFYWQLCKV